MDDILPQIIRVNDVNSGAFFHLQQLYEFEFSRITKSELNEDGLYDYKALQASWNEHNYHAYLFVLNKRPIGFCVVNLNSQINKDENIKDIAEFFMMPNVRHKKFGEKLAQTIFNMYPGQWEVRQLLNAPLARKFWLKTIQNYTNGNFKEKEFEDFFMQSFCAV